MPDLAFVVSRIDDRAVRLAPRRYTPQGVPVYDLAAGEVLVAGSQPPTSSGGDQALVNPSGWTILTVAPKPFAPQSLGGVFRGQPRWSYPSLWPGLHASHESPPPERPGELIGTTRLLGGLVTPRGGQSGPLWAVNGNMGNIYLFTADGLFVAELFRDIRKGEAWAMPVAQRGMLLNDVSLHDENFWPSIAQTSDGEVYLVDGARTSLVRVRRADDDPPAAADALEVTADDLLRPGMPPAKRGAAAEVRGPPDAQGRVRSTPPVVDGKLDDWAGTDRATIDRSGVAAFFDSRSKPVRRHRRGGRGRRPSLRRLSNGRPPPAAQLGRDAPRTLQDGRLPGPDDRRRPPADADRSNPVPGDARLLVTLVRDKPLALLYRAVVPGTKDPVPFSSPWRTITIDRVDDVSDQLQFAGQRRQLRAVDPAVRAEPQARPGQVLQGDVGILRGNGFETLHRVYWSNKATAITSDVPSEAQLTPRLWGRWVEEAAK